MLQQLTEWLASLVVRFFTALWDFAVDVLVQIVDLLLVALAALISAIPLPDFIGQGMSTLFAGLNGPILYLLSAAGFTQALALYAAGWGFRLIRKFVTLFQW